jgi:hypothetical protein
MVEHGAPILKDPPQRPTTAYVDQISLPMRIALAASLVFAALWFVALRPKPVDVDGPLPGEDTAVTSRPDQAAKAVESANAKTAGRDQAAGADKAHTSTPAQPQAAKTEAKADVATTKPKAPEKVAVAKTAPRQTGAKAVLADIKAGRTVLLLFYHPSRDSADDQAVLEAVKAADRHDGRVRVHTATLGKLGQYEAITKTATIQSTPTVLVIDRKAQVRALEGLTVTREIDALVDRALKVSE